MPLPKAEEELIKAFFAKERRERYLEGLANPRKRRRITNIFCHFDHLDLRYMVQIPSFDQHPQNIYRLLKQYGAPDECWVVSDELFLDSRMLNLKETLEGIVGRTFANFLCCVDAKLAYFENEEGRWILRRP
jgi:hypothetical protein